MTPGADLLRIHEPEEDDGGDTAERADPEADAARPAQRLAAPHKVVV